MYDVLGVGIDLQELNKGGIEKINIEVVGTKYVLDCKEAKSFIIKFGSVKTLKGGRRRLGIVSKSLLKPLHSYNENGIFEQVKRL